MEISVTLRFTKNYKKLNSVIKEKAKVKERIFRKNPFDKRLKTHKLSGKEKGIWAFRVDYSYRIKFTRDPRGTRYEIVLQCMEEK